MNNKHNKKPVMGWLEWTYAISITFLLVTGINLISFNNASDVLNHQYPLTAALLLGSGFISVAVLLTMSEIYSRKD